MDLTPLPFSVALIACRWGDQSLNLCAFEATASGHSLGSSSVAFYGNLVTKDKAIEHQGDNDATAGSGDKERIIAALESVDGDCNQILLAVALDVDADSLIDLDASGPIEVRVCDVSEDECFKLDVSSHVQPGDRGIVVGRIVRHEGGWALESLMKAYEGGLPDIIAAVGLHA